jgi:hypothetical protein
MSKIPPPLHSFTLIRSPRTATAVTRLVHHNMEWVRKRRFVDLRDAIQAGPDWARSTCSHNVSQGVFAGHRAGNESVDRDHCNQNAPPHRKEDRLRQTRSGSNENEAERPKPRRPLLDRLARRSIKCDSKLNPSGQAQCGRATAREAASLPRSSLFRPL